MAEPRKVVLLEGGETECRRIHNLLSKHVMVTCAKDIPELLSILQDNGYDALFCDWSFDKSSWREALEEVRRRYRELPIIVVHHSADEQEWVDVLDAGAFDLLGPPYSERLLLAILDHVFVSREALHVA
jgi:DNA-binding response OmpR family regulator